VAVSGNYAYTINSQNYVQVFDCSQAITFFQTEVTISRNNDDILLQWQSVPDALEYHIYYQDTPYFEPTGAPQASIAPPFTSWTDAGAFMQGRRFYRVVVEY
jgi:hypothetical protein